MITVMDKEIYITYRPLNNVIVECLTVWH